MRERASRERAKAFLFHALYLSCHQKVGLQFRVGFYHLQWPNQGKALRTAQLQALQADKLYELTSLCPSPLLHCLGHPGPVCRCLVPSQTFVTWLVYHSVARSLCSHPPPLLPLGPLALRDFFPLPEGAIALPLYRLESPDGRAAQVKRPSHPHALPRASLRSGQASMPGGSQPGNAARDSPFPFGAIDS